MKLSLIFSQLQSAELNNLSCVDPATKKVKPERYADLIATISAGLTDLHGRFLLKLGMVTFPLVSGQDVYNLNVIDKATKGNLLKIHAVKDNCGRELGLNDFTERFSVFTTDTHTIHVPQHLMLQDKVSSLTVTYRKNHTPLVYDDSISDADELDYINIELDHAYLYALCLYVASRLHGPVGLQDSTHTINAYVGMYNAECNRLEEANLALDYVATNTRAYRAGWP